MAASSSPQPSPTISACLVVYQEEAVIRRCLESLQGVVDEIIVVHDGHCTDNTPIAREFGARTFERLHSGSCEAHRVFSYEAACGEWILQIDADEYLSPELRGELRALTRDGSIDAYAFRWPYTDGHRVLKGYENQTKTALFRKREMYFVAITHQPPLTYGTLQTRLDLTLEHWPTDSTFSFAKFKRKHLAWNRIQAAEILHIADLPVFNIPDKAHNPLFAYYSQQRAHPYWFALKRYVLFDLAKKLLRTNPWYTLVVHWRVAAMFYISVLYTAYCIDDLESEAFSPLPTFLD